jgi:hypothetical protein
MGRLSRLLFLLAAAPPLVSCAGEPAPSDPRPEARAVAFLAREVPAWQPKNRCFSCHNNGDAARALAEARRAGFDVGSALAATSAWLRDPEAWDENGPEGEFNDRALADLQFAFAAASVVDDPAVSARAVRRLSDRQNADGSFGDDTGGLPGGPVTYGRTLATAAARRVLVKAGDVRLLARVDAWLKAKPPVRVMDASALLLSGGPIDRAASLDVLRKGRQADGGWGPYVESRSEVFDTALAVLALRAQPESDEVRAWIEGGRRFLLAAQSADGSWPETTRPGGAVSYAHRISTSGWATLALLRK